MGKRGEDSKRLCLTPEGIVDILSEENLISMDFNSVLLKVADTSFKNEGYILCKVIIGGIVGGRKAVKIEGQRFKLPPFSKKDHHAIFLAKKYGITHFTLSFMESFEDVNKFRAFYPGTTLYSKIESKKGLQNFIKIAEVSEGVLIDRGDLSREVPLEKIPFIQKKITKKVREMGKKVFVATNTLEQMAFSLKPNKAEVNDIINTLLDGVSGIALTKETAVGKYPVETVNMVKDLMNQLSILERGQGKDIFEKMEDVDYENLEDFSERGIEPHGGKLINLFSPNYLGKIPEKTLEVSEEILMDAEQIAEGGFSPLEGFMGSKDLLSVADNLRLENGLLWPLPIVLQITQEESLRLVEGEDLLLTHKGGEYVILHLREIYCPNKEDIIKKVYGFSDLNHPGVRKFIESGDYFLGGKITLLKKKNLPYKAHELTPSQTRKIFLERGWSKIVGFHTRNIVHRSHEFIQKIGMKKGFCDGLFVHPIVGKKKTGDFESEMIIRTYEEMMAKGFYPKSKVLFGTLSTYSRYGGPREALFTALVRKNFGCTHFIVGRDHTGVGNFYQETESQEIFEKFSSEEIGIIPIKFGDVFYSSLEKRYIHENEFIDYPDEYKERLSGTKVREIFKKGEQPPSWLIRPEISKIILDNLAKNNPVFVGDEKQIKIAEESKKTKILWFTGLSGSGKSSIVEELTRKMNFLGKSFKVLDGDEIRKEFHLDLKFTPQDILENNRLILELCKKEEGRVDFMFVSIISPFKKSREDARDFFTENFVEVFINCSYEECKKRDVKGLYKKAEAGEIENFIGLHIPYEPPKDPHLEIDSLNESIEVSTQKILNYLSGKD